MNDLKLALERAAAEGVITGEQAGRLLPYLHFEPARVGEIADTETPRFVRGFHDVLITIGVVIALVGITGFASAFAAVPLIVVLAEILVRRQRLALPAVALAIATTVVALLLAYIAADAWLAGAKPLLRLMVVFAPVAAALALFTWRYRVPLALAGLFATLASMALAGLFHGLQTILGSGNLLADHRALAVAILLAAALLLFGLAMHYDLADPRRVTRRSDVAFWLHLVTAPALLLAALSAFTVDGVPVPFLIGGGGLAQMAGPAIAIVAVLMIVGVVIDRRAFVTSGLVSLISACVALLRKGQMEASDTVFAALFLVGVLVLTIGVGWRPLRGFVVGRLPAAVRDRLPPVA